MSEYLKKYPWSRLMNLYTGRVYRNKSAADAIPEGWMLAFGDLMFEELDDAIKRAHVEDTFVVLQVKEKLGTLRFKHNQPHNSEIDLICKRYEMLSRYVCIRCGCLTPDSKLVFAPWIRPMCSSCFTKTEHENNKETYEELTADSSCEIPTVMAWEEFERYDNIKKKSVYKKFEYDISDTVAKIQEHWQERVTNGTHIVETSDMDRTYTIEEMRENIDRILKEDFDDDDE